MPQLDETKLAWHRDRVEAWLRGEHIAPITIDCALSTACNYACEYCYGTLQKRCGSIGHSTILRFLDDAVEMGVKGISFVSDGESTCSPHFYEAVRYGRANGLSLAVGTNGRLLRRSMLFKLVTSLDYLRFNISAGSPARYAQIHGCKEEDFHHVVKTIDMATTIKRLNELPCTIGMQMVFLPRYKDQLIPLATLGRDLGVDYLVIKHCSDDENHSLGVNYEEYGECVGELKKAEAFSTPSYRVVVKWSKIIAGEDKGYSRCYGPAFIPQFSGSGLIAPCGMFFNEKFSKYHLGNLDDGFKAVWQSDRTKAVLAHLASEKFDAQQECGFLCLQHKANEYLNALKKGEITLKTPEGEPPPHVNFV